MATIMTTQADFRQRRETLFSRMPEKSVALVASAPIQHRNSDAEHLYRQDSYFYYLTGFNESFAMAVFIKNPKGNQFVLFCQERNKEQEKWTGLRAGPQGAMDQYGADKAFPIAEAAIRFPGLFDHVEQVLYLMGLNPAFDKQLMGWMGSLRKQQRKGTPVPHQFVDLRTLLDEMRLLKRSEEIKCMQKAADIAVDAHIKAMRRAKPGVYEYQLQAELMHSFLDQGSPHVSYSPIVATGQNACILHYVDNRSCLKDGDLVLIDAGCEYENYASDVTRTFPANGKFSRPQQAIYEIVLAAQLAAIESLKPGVAWDKAQQIIIEVILSGLKDLKILKGDLSGLLESQAHKPFYMHNSGHWLGLDVHDVGDYKQQDQWRPLEPGMVLTVEPGIYIDPEDTSVDSAYRGIGIRIEDDILITQQGCEVLTDALPKKIDDIENLMKK